MMDLNPPPHECTFEALPEDARKYLGQQRGGPDLDIDVIDTRDESIRFKLHVWPECCVRASLKEIAAEVLASGLEQDQHRAWREAFEEGVAAAVAHRENRSARNPHVWRNAAFEGWERGFEYERDRQILERLKANLDKGRGHPLTRDPETG